MNAPSVLNTAVNASEDMIFLKGLLENPRQIQTKIEMVYQDFPLWRQFRLLELAITEAAKERDDQVVAKKLLPIFLKMLNCLSVRKPKARALRNVLSTSLAREHLFEGYENKYAPGFLGMMITLEVIEMLEKMPERS